jgi:hypothetical protein
MAELRGRQAVTSLKKDPVAECRARAKFAREKAERETDERVRAALLSEADVWERMANYEEQRTGQPDSN